MIVTIDGPAGAGKSSVARQLARHLGFQFLDTGAMYRAVALAGLRTGVDWDDPAGLEALLEKVELEFAEDQVRLDGEEVNAAIRQPEVTDVVHYVADHPGIRARLVELQRQLAGENMVAEGRDQGTVAFPNAECKFFLTASPEERARRRQAELSARGVDTRFEEVLAQQEDRDQRDRQRSVGGMRVAEDAVQVVTDGMSSSEVVEHLAAIVRARAGRARQQS